MKNSVIKRRRFIQWMTTLGGLFAASKVAANHTDTHFDERSPHRIVFQCNKADPQYWSHIMFSSGEILRKYGDDVEIVIAAFGPGIQILGKNPTRPVPEEIKQRVSSLASYGVSFHACGNTMKALQWTEDDLVDFAKVVQAGVDDIMLLQEDGFAYFSW